MLQISPYSCWVGKARPPVLQPNRTNLESKLAGLVIDGRDLAGGAAALCALGVADSNREMGQLGPAEQTHRHKEAVLKAQEKTRERDKGD